MTADNNIIIIVAKEKEKWCLDYIYCKEISCHCLRGESIPGHENEKPIWVLGRIPETLLLFQRRELCYSFIIFYSATHFLPVTMKSSCCSNCIYSSTGEHCRTWDSLYICFLGRVPRGKNQPSYITPQQQVLYSRTWISVNIKSFGFFYFYLDVMGLELQFWLLLKFYVYSSLIWALPLTQFKQHERELNCVGLLFLLSCRRLDAC